MKKKLLLLIIACLSLSTSSSYARHIISGMMAYECLEEGSYQIEMLLYRDCLGNGAAFDQEAYFNIYKNNQFYNAIRVADLTIEQEEPMSFEGCTDEFGAYCVEKGRYTFRLDLPVSEETYTIVYQRCCWSASIANIINAEGTGTSILTEITPKAQRVCNKQYLYESQLALLACPSTDVALMMPTFDEEGDSLAVQLCLPFKGGGPNTYEIGACNSPVPQANCPPPYEETELVEGFDVLNPFPTEDGITIDPSTNTIRFVPTTIGRYIFSLCFTEYRDGEILSQYRTTSHAQMQVKTTVSNEETLPSELDINLFHANDNINIIANVSLTNTEVLLSDLNGRRLQQLAMHNTNSLAINTLSLASGIYVVQVLAEGRNIKVQKVYVP